MFSLNKKQALILIIVLAVFFCGFLGWSLIQRAKILSGINPQGGVQEEVLAISGIVKSVDSNNNFLMLKPNDSEKEVKVQVSQATKLIKLELPFDPQNPPKEATFSPKETEIKLSGIKAGDNVFIKANENIFGKTKIDNVDFIHILP